MSKYQPSPAAHRRGMGLCLSGGGFRAVLFHPGALRRVNELRILSKVTTISSVPGGSIAAGLLAKQLANPLPRRGRLVPRLSRLRAGASGVLFARSSDRRSAHGSAESGELALPCRKRSLRHRLPEVSLSVSLDAKLFATFLGVSCVGLRSRCRMGDDESMNFGRVSLTNTSPFFP